ncbi:hypothetical protein HRS9122_09819 [Pyrenophora teres f. teres]|nr:hypothetical protein HRS9122_09819 [Pyrenophora teres f. teres]
MSSSTPKDAVENPPPQQQQQQEPQDTSESHAPLPLPAPPTDLDPSTTTKLDVGGQAVKLDKLGPLVVNKDGTLSRIANWDQMADIEKANTLRVLGKRNMLRREDLERKAGGGVMSDMEIVTSPCFNVMALHV